MALRKICIRKSERAFSLIELLVALGVIAVVVSFTAFATLTDYRALSFRSDRELIVRALEKAREESMHGSCFGNSCSEPAAHGVHIAPGMLTIFQGTAYSPGDALNEVLQSSGQASASGFTDVVFEPLSGNAVSSPGNTLTLVEAGRTSLITVGSEGMISD